MEQEDAYPGWQPDPGSAVLQLTREVLEELTGAPAQGACSFATCIKCIHMECCTDEIAAKVRCSGCQEFWGVLGV